MSNYLEKGWMKNQTKRGILHQTVEEIGQLESRLASLRSMLVFQGSFDSGLSVRAAKDCLKYASKMTVKLTKLETQIRNLIVVANAFGGQAVIIPAKEEVSDFADSDMSGNECPPQSPEYQTDVKWQDLDSEDV